MTPGDGSAVLGLRVPVSELVRRLDNERMHA